MDQNKTVASPCSEWQWSGVSPPGSPSLCGSLRLMLSREPKWTRLLERRLMSGDVSDSPGTSSALVGVTVKRTDAMATGGHKEEFRNVREDMQSCVGDVKSASQLTLSGWGIQAPRCSIESVGCCWGGERGEEDCGNAVRSVCRVLNLTLTLTRTECALCCPGNSWTIMMSVCLLSLSVLCSVTGSRGCFV